MVTIAVDESCCLLFYKQYYIFHCESGEKFIINNNKVVGGKMMNDHKLNFEKSDFIKYTKIFEEYRKTLENSTENAKGEIKLYVEYPREISDFQRIFSIPIWLILNMTAR